MIVVVRFTQPHIGALRYIYSAQSPPHGMRKPLVSHMVPTALPYNAGLAAPSHCRNLIKLAPQFPSLARLVWRRSHCDWWKQ